jgi:hypothetical protein
MAGLTKTGQPLEGKPSFYILWSSAPLVQREKLQNSDCGKWRRRYLTENRWISRLLENSGITLEL